MSQIEVNVGAKFKQDPCFEVLTAIERLDWRASQRSLTYKFNNTVSEPLKLIIII